MQSLLTKQKNSILPYFLPIITIIVLAFAFSGPWLGFSGLTGFIANPNADSGTDLVIAGGEVNSQIRLSASSDNIIPAGSLVSIRIYGTASDSQPVQRSASMGIEEFVGISGRLSGQPSEPMNGETPAIGYKGPGYAGHNYTIPLAEFGIDRSFPSGDYALITDISYQSSIIASSERDIEVP